MTTQMIVLGKWAELKQQLLDAARWRRKAVLGLVSKKQAATQNHKRHEQRNNVQNVTASGNERVLFCLVIDEFL